jgi:hypothetical protein
MMFDKKTALPHENQDNQSAAAATLAEDEYCKYEPNPKARTDQAAHDLDVLSAHCLRYDLGVVYRL